MDNPEKKNRRIALITTTGIHVAIFLLLWFLVAWRAPDPPLPEYGIQLNFGLSQQGSGDVQPETPPSTDDEATDEELAENSEPTPQEPQPVEQPQPEATTEQPVETPVSKVESPVSVKEEPKEKLPEPVKEKKEEPKPEEKPLVQYKKNNPTESKSTGKGESGKPATSQGDDENKAGDKGNPQGSLDAKALYGNQGGGGGDGLALSMSGWAWADQPAIPSLPDNADGRIVFEIECDANGEIIGITTIERGLSPRAEQLLKEEIRRNSLIRTSGGQVPTRSKGRVVFVLRTK